MAYTITSQCINCSRCVSQCPTGAIQAGDHTHWIDPALCNHCLGSYAIPQCAAICPTNGGCVSDIPEYWERWFNRYHQLVSRLNQTCQPSYWEHWFDTYSQHLAKLIDSVV